MESISIIIPVFNSMRTLKLCLDSIVMQDYDKGLLEIIFADGGSTDGTIELIKQYKNNMQIDISLYDNPLRTAEAGKAVGVKKAKYKIVGLIDSDNILPNGQWLKKMVEPFKYEDIIASEPISYTYRKKDSVVNRYCALIGMNDPMCMFTGNYDRRNLITNRWTEVPREEKEYKNFITAKFCGMIPTIGANGFFMQKNKLLESFQGDYLFDIDILWELFHKEPNWKIAKVKTGIIHLYCPDIKTFYRKQNRRIMDYLYFSNIENSRKYPWNKVNKNKIILFCISCVTVIPLIIQAVIGYSRKKDISAWLFHLFACWITLWAYGTGTIKSIFKKSMASREAWKQ